MSAAANLVSDAFKGVTKLFGGGGGPDISIPGSGGASPRISDAQLAERTRRRAAAGRGFEANILSGGENLGSATRTQVAGGPLNGTGGVKGQAGILGG